MAMSRAFPMKRRFKITTDLTVGVIYADDRWKFLVKELGFILYGKTEQKMDEVLSSAMQTLVDSMKGDLKRLTNYLEHRGVVYRVDEENSIMQSHTIEETMLERVVQEGYARFSMSEDWDSSKAGYLLMRQEAELVSTG